MLDDNQFALNDSALSGAFGRQESRLIYLFVPMYAILFFIGTFGNGLVIISILRSSRLRTVTNSYLLNIAIADFVLLLSVPFLVVTILANGWIFGNVLCKMYYNFIHINQYVSSLLLAALSFDRYLAVCHPIGAIEFRTKTKCAIIIAGCWIMSVLLLCPTWVFATVLSEQEVMWFGYRVEKCVIDFPAIIFRIPPEIVFTYYVFFLGFLIPASMITTFYVLLLLRLNTIRRKHQSETKQRSHRKVTRIVLAVITAYFVCWLPYWLLQIFITIDPLIDSLRLNFSILPANTNMSFLKELTHLTTIIGYANNCLNPVLYVFLSDSFREEYIVLLKCFHLGRMFTKHGLDSANANKHFYTRSHAPQSSMQLTNQHEMPLRALKHSIATDEVASYYGSCSLLSPHCDATQRSPQPSSIEINEREYRHEKHLTLSPTDAFIRSSSHEENRALPMKTFAKAPRFSSLNMIDDGGVYCGD